MTYTILQKNCLFKQYIVSYQKEEKKKRMIDRLSKYGKIHLDTFDARQLFALTV